MIRKSGVLFLKGILLGVSIVLPGVSGGTMAFILGIYERLIDEIAKFNFQQFKYFLNLITFKKEKIIKNFFLIIKLYDWAFIVPLCVGSIFAVIVFISIAPPVIERYFVEFYSLIFGLIVVSLYSPFKQMKKNFRSFSFLILSFCFNFLCLYMFQEGVSVQQEMPLLLFLPAGFLASITLIVPGVSGAYILVLLGLYQTTLEALRDLNFLVILLFLLGVFLGLIVSIRLVKRAFKRYFTEFIAIIIGLILGSLYGLWSIIEAALQSQTSFQQGSLLFLFYMFIPLTVVIIYNIFYRFLKKNDNINRL